MSDDAIGGGCLCGAVCFEIRPPTLFNLHCHCSMCRRNHGAAYVTWVGVPREQLRILAGADALTRHASSPHGARSFCSRCGSSLFCENEQHPDHVDILLANLDGPTDRAPEGHIYWSDRAPWVAADDGLPRLGGETGLSPIED